jgi:large subunit ribosomal protein L30
MSETKKTAVKTTTKKAAKTTTGKTITVKLVKGVIACSPNQRACINGLGLKRREQEKTLENTPAVRGMIKKVLHLVQVVSESK